FAQAWLQFGFDSNGNPVDVNADSTGLRRAGRLNDPTLAQLDAQVGYWVYRAAESNSRLQGLAPFAELHYNSTVGGPDVVAANGFLVGDLGRLDELNISAGLVAQIGDNVNLTLGAAAPVRGAPNRTFDYQIGLRGTIFFGPTARTRAAAAQAS